MVLSRAAVLVAQSKPRVSRKVDIGSTWARDMDCPKSRTHHEEYFYWKLVLTLHRSLCVRPLAFRVTPMAG